MENNAQEIVCGPSSIRFSNAVNEFIHPHSVVIPVPILNVFNDDKLLNEPVYATPETTLSGIVRLVKPQLLKQPAVIAVTLDGIVTLDNFGRLLKEPSVMTVTLFPIVSDDNDGSPVQNAFPILVTPFPITRSVNPLQPAIGFPDICVTVSGMTSFSRL